jgi:hypothetical protein
VLLDGLPAPELRAYPKATVIAEKLHAICLLGLANTRMKDYFDLDLLLQDEALDLAELRRAIGATFARRGMALPDDRPVGLSDAFAAEPVKQAQWTTALRRILWAPRHISQQSRRDSLFVSETCRPYKSIP